MLNPTTTAPSASHADETFKRAAWRFMPLLFVCYVVAYLDRVNVGFAKLQMLNDLHFSDAMYGFGAGLFFIGYFCFEVPSNLLLHKLGARRWIARIMVTWAVLSMLTAWVHSPLTFYIIRFFLGVAEAGFFPGMVLYLTYWFPSHRRGKMVAVLMSGNPVSGIVGGPISGFIMHAFSGVSGMQGWQWLFIIEGIPAIALGVLIFYFLDDRVRDAKWLSEAEKQIIEGEIAEDASVRTVGSLREVFRSVRVYLLCLILFGIVMGSYAIGFWQPTIIRNSGVKDPFVVGMLTVIPYTCALIGMLLIGRHADKTRERRWHVTIPIIGAALGFCICAFSSNQLVPSMIGLTLATTGVICALPMFWALPTAFLGGTAAAAGIALINSTGNLAGFVSPVVIGWLNTETKTLSAGLYLVAAALAMSAVLIQTRIPARLVNR